MCSSDLRTWLKDETLKEQTEKAILGGVTFVQLREKNLDFDLFVKEGKEIKELCRKYSVPFVINDDVNVMLAVDADGIHIGQSDENARKVREIIGKDKILGVSAQTVAQAKEAEANGADYIGVGAVFTTTSKDDADSVSFETLREICENVSIPVVAIGGINENNILELKDSKIDGVAIISAIFGKNDIKKATENLKKLLEEIV